VFGLLAGLAVLLAGGVHKARAQQFSGYFQIQSVATGKVLDVPGFSTSDGTLIQQYQANGGSNQKWSMVPNGPLYRGSDGRWHSHYLIVSRSSNKVLDVWCA
jgi:glucosylceramidase